MKWFKHYTNASNSVKLNNLIDKLGVEGYGRYWLFLELLGEEFDGINPEISVHLRKIQAKVHLKQTKSVERFIRLLVESQLTTVQKKEKVYIFDGTILLELQSKDFKYDRNKRKSTDPKNKIKNKNKKERENSRFSYGKNPEFLSKHNELIEIWNSNRGSKKAAPLIPSPAAHQKISDVMDEIPDLKDWEKIIKFGVKDKFWKKTINFHWLTNPEKIESIHMILNQALDCDEKPKVERSSVF